MEDEIAEMIKGNLWGQVFAVSSYRSGGADFLSVPRKVCHITQTVV
jgi:hypothetical protein